MEENKKMLDKFGKDCRKFPPSNITLMYRAIHPTVRALQWEWCLFPCVRGRKEK